MHVGDLAANGSVVLLPGAVQRVAADPRHRRARVRAVLRTAWRGDRSGSRPVPGEPPDLVSSLTGGTLRYALGELAGLPRAAVVVEDRYSAIFTLDRVRPAVVADGLAELQVRWPTVPLVFCETRPLAEEWTYRYLGAAHTWAASEPAALARITGAPGELDNAPAAPEPSTAEVRAWARAHAITVPDRGRLRPEVWNAWRAAHGDGAHTGAAVL